jgi:hypothetical protein
MMLSHAFQLDVSGAAPVMVVAWAIVGIGDRC